MDWFLNISHVVLEMLMQSASISLVMRRAFGLRALNRIDGLRRYRKLEI